MKTTSSLTFFLQNQVEYVSETNSLPKVIKLKQNKQIEEEEALSENHINHFHQVGITKPTTLPPYKQITEPGLIKTTVRNRNNDSIQENILAINMCRTGFSIFV